MDLAKEIKESEMAFIELTTTVSQQRLIELCEGEDTSEGVFEFLADVVLWLEAAKSFKSIKARLLPVALTALLLNRPDKAINLVDSFCTAVEDILEEGRK